MRGITLKKICYAQKVICKTGIEQVSGIYLTVKFLIILFILKLYDQRSIFQNRATF